MALQFNFTEFPPLPSRNTKRAESRPQKSPSIVVRPDAASLGKLPDELLLSILDYLPCLDLKNFQLPSMLALSAVNRRFHTLVLEYLYLEYNSFFGDPYLFLRTMICNSQAANMVKNLKLSYGHGVHEERTVYVPTAQDRRDIKNGLKELGISNWKSWASDCNSECMDQETLYAAILMYTPNVVSLELDDGAVPYDGPRWLELIRQCTSRSLFGSVHRFPHLSDIRIDIGELRLSNMAPIFRLPSLRTLVLVGLVETIPLKKWTVPAQSSTIELLKLQDCFMSAENVVLILNTCRALKELYHAHQDERWFYRRQGGGGIILDHITWEREYPYIAFAYQTLYEGLIHHRQSLKHLSLTHGPFDVLDPMTVGHLGDLKELEALETVEGPFDAFMDEGMELDEVGIDMFPRSLGTFSIRLHRLKEVDVLLILARNLSTSIDTTNPSMLTSINVGVPHFNSDVIEKVCSAYDTLKGTGVTLFLEQTFDETEDNWREDAAVRIGEGNANLDSDSESETSSDYSLDDE